MVAKSFQSMTQIGEPYKSGNKMYVKVKNEKTGNVRQVRWYSQQEYAKLYGESTSPVEEEFNFKKNQREVLGFQKGYITIFRGDQAAYNDWFKLSNARYCRWWGWYIISTEDVPNNLPFGIEPIQLSWNLVGTDEGVLKPEYLVRQGVESVLFTESRSQFQGTIGERLNLNLVLISVSGGDNYYGKYTIHVFEDLIGNQFIWKTNSKTLEVGQEYKIKGTVKDFQIVKNVKTTILTRCTQTK